MQPFQCIRKFRVLHIFGVSLIDHHDHVFRHGLQKAMQIGFAQPRSGWIIRVGNEYHAGRIVDFRGKIWQIVPVRHGVMRRGIGFSKAQLRPHRSNCNRVHRKSVFGTHRRAVFIQVRAGNNVQHVVRTITQGNLLAV